MSDATPIAEATGDNAPNPSAIPADELARMTDDIVSALKTVYDPEIPVDIYELGLIYKVDIDDDRNVAIDMTLTAPAALWQVICRAGWRTLCHQCPVWPTAKPKSLLTRHGTIHA